MCIQVVAGTDSTAAFFDCDPDEITSGGIGGTSAGLAGSYTPPCNDGSTADGTVDVVRLLPVVLGKGSFGRVYEGTYRGQRVAVKQVLDLSDGVDGATLEVLQASFAQELEVLGRCEHPNILRILAACLTPPRPCLVMELMDTSLDKMLHGKLLPLPLVLHIASEIALGLAYLHPTSKFAWFASTTSVGSSSSSS
ncbi:putative serine/threonine-protein kinase [Tetrabaena socialis]|uniref:Putative serine/threonine-protein kinase n=1 Tax=Tetrabaena socialis TaxID=47790 RepID=A0A2J8AG68_9CHLO|nr:putative serine/threonine-protein kinase [Tetrabaena socialis]|eukprot:PNH11514.1 putative serine/threonine-protein kinase [Tetrabaena socialis]